MKGGGAALEGTAAVASDPLATLREQREAWERRPLLRDLYRDWYERIVHELSRVEGLTVELGSGIGSFKEFFPRAVATDVFESPWAEEVVDAQDLPHAGGSLANLVMVDLLHHVPAPLRCLEEAERVLAPGGRAVLLEPYCSPVSRWLYRWFHHEPVDLEADPFSDRPLTSDDPWDANTAAPTLIFWRGLDRLERRCPRLRVVRRERIAWLVYPLSGGFSGRRLVPYRLGRALRGIEERLPLARLAALRCLVVLEKRAAR